MDQFYFEEGYLEGKYFVYIADAKVDLGPYIDSTYISADYFVDNGAVATITAELTEVLNVIVDFAAALSTSVSLTAQAGRIQNITVNWSGVFASTMTINASRDGDVDLNTDTVMSTVAVANRSTQITLDNITNLNAQAGGVVKFTASLDSEFTQTALGGYPRLAESTFTSTTSLTGLTRVLLRNTQVTVNSGGRYDAITFDPDVKKFGTHSAFFGDSTNILPSAPISIASGFRIIQPGYTWTSSNGTTWNRFDNDLTESIGEISLANNLLIAFSNEVTDKIWYSSDAISWLSSTTFTRPGDFLPFGTGIIHFSGNYYVMGRYSSSGTWRIGWRRVSSLTGSWSNVTEISNTGISTSNSIFTSSATFGSYGVWGYSGRSGSNRIVVAGRYSSSPVSKTIYTSTTGNDQNLSSVINNGASDWGALLTNEGTGATYLRWTTDDGSTYNDDTSVNAQGIISLYSGRYFLDTSTGTFTGTSISFLSKFTDRRLFNIRGSSNVWIRYDDTWTGSIQRSTNATTWTVTEISQTSGVPANIVYTRDDGSDLGSWSTVDFWYRTTTTAISSGLGVLVFDSANGFAQLRRSSNILVLSNGSTSLSITGITADTWHHIRFSRSGADTSVYLDGVRKATTNSFIWPADSELRIGHGINFYIDELLVSDQLLTAPSVTSFTVPTEPWTQDSFTDLLVHFDNSAQDDAKFDPIVIVDLESEFGISATSDTVKEIQALLASSLSQSVTASAIRDVSETFNVDSAQITDVEKTVSAQLDLTAEVDLSVTADVSREFAVTADTVTDQTALAEVTRDFEIAQSSAFTSSITVRATRVGDIELIVTVTLQSSAAKTADAAATLDSESDQTTVIEATKDVIIDLTVDSGQNTAIDRLRDIVSDLSSEFATAIDIDKFKDTGSDLSAEFAQTTAVQAIRDGLSTLNVDTDISADTDRTRDTDLDLSTQIDITATATRIKSADLALSVSLDQTTEAAKTTDVTVTEAVTVTQTASPVKTVDAVIDQDVIATQISVSALIANRESQLAATTAMTVVTGKLIDNTFKSAIGVSSDSEDENPDRTPFLKYGTSNSTGTSTQSKFVMSMWVYKPIGYIFDADPNRPAYIPSGTPGDLDRLNSSIRVENSGGVPFLYYYGQEGFAVWPLGSSRQELDQGYRHFLISVDLSKPTNSEKYRFWLDGQEVTGLEVYRISGVGAGTNFTLQTSAYNIPMLAYGQYHLMMNTTNVSPGSIEKLANNGSGYGDADQNLENRSGLTQFWWDYGGTYDLTQSGRLKFYNAGYVDLGEDGTNSGLASPKHYVRLLNIQDINEGGNQGGNWSWRKLTFTGQRLGGSLGPRIFVIDPATPTLDENSVGQLPGFRANFFLTAKTEGVFLYTATLTADTALTATGFRTLELTGDLTLDSDQLTQIGVIRQADSDLAVTADVTAQAVKTTDVESALLVNANITAQVGDLDTVEALLASAFGLEITAVIIDPERASALLQAESTLATSADVIVNNEIIADSEFTLTADVTQIPPIRIEADLTVDTTLTVSIGAIEQFAILVASSGTLTVDAEALKDAILTLTAQTDQSTDADRVRSSTVTLNAGVFAVTAGDVINLDPQLTLTIKAETRNLLILPETRVFEVESETRTLIITKG